MTRRSAEKGIFDVSSEDTEYVKVVSKAREHVEKCVGPSMPCIPKDECSRKSDAMPIFQRARKPEAVNVSTSARSGENHRSKWTTSPEKDTCPNSFTVWRKSPSLEKKKR